MLLADSLLFSAGACAGATAAQRRAFLSLTFGDPGLVPIIARSLVERALTGGRQELDFLMPHGIVVRHGKQPPLTAGQARMCCALAALCGLAECELAPLPALELEHCVTAAVALARCSGVPGEEDCARWRRQFRVTPPQHRQLLQLDSAPLHPKF